MPRIARVSLLFGLASALTVSLLSGPLTQFALASSANATIVAWGNNGGGETNVPAGLSGVTVISAGGVDSLALKSDGTVVAWGGNNFGESNVPAGLSDVIAISEGTYFSLALKSDGTVVGWGDDSDGATNLPTGLSDVTAIAAGGGYMPNTGFALALKRDGTVVAWGSDQYGESDVPTGLSDVVAIAASTDGAFALALKNDGTVVAWGAQNVPAGLSGVTAISAGGFHCLALKNDGTVVAWGGEQYGQSTVPAGLSGVTAISAGEDQSLALKNDGTVVAWGGNYDGQASVPAGLIDVTAISAGTEFNLAIGTLTPNYGSAIMIGAAALLGVMALGILVWYLQYRRPKGTRTRLAARHAGSALPSQQSYAAPMTEPAATLPNPPVQAAPLAPAAWLPTHSVPSGGMAAWDSPDASRQPVVPLMPGLDVVVEQRSGDWALVRDANGWTGWVDARALVARQ
jgi:hypothetical protein